METLSLPKTTLYYKQGSSDKVYSVEVVADGDGFSVNTGHGRRGAALRFAFKNKAPLPLDKAIALYEKVVGEKSRKDYTPAEFGEGYTQTPRESQSTGLIPQLLNAIDHIRLAELIDDPNYCAQEKFDGERLIAGVRSSVPFGSNRRGLERPIPEGLANAMIHQAGDSDMVLDGEMVGNIYHVFDYLVDGGTDIKHVPYSQRFAAVLELEETNHLIRVDTAFTSAAKAELVEGVRSRGGEGVVFKRIDAPYTSGRPNSGGDQLKFKFTESATCRVASVHDSKRSIGVEVIDEDSGEWVGVGNCTIPANYDIPQVAQFVEIRYLYAYRGGSLYQPVFLGVRSDVADEDCQLGSLKFKVE